MGGKENPEKYTSERCFIAEIINDPDWPEFSIARCRVEPGASTQLHAVAVHEIYVIEQGLGLVTIGDSAPFSVTPGDTVNIPKHCAQSITNRGTTDLIFSCICAPKFSQDCYTSLE